MKEGSGARCHEDNQIQIITNSSANNLEIVKNCHEHCDAIGSCKYAVIDTGSRFTGGCYLFRDCGQSSKPFEARQYRRKEGIT